jgi:hypothetical protein
MAFTKESNQKMVAKLIEKYGKDENGKSIYHQRAGSAPHKRRPGYFARLSETPEGRLKLAEISRRGGAARNAKDSGR